MGVSLGYRVCDSRIKNGRAESRLYDSQFAGYVQDCR